MEGDALWERPLYQPGGARPELFFVSFGDVPADWSIKGSLYRTGGIPERVSVSAYGPGSSPELVDSFREGYLWETFCKAEPEAAREAARQSSCVVIRGEVAGDNSLSYLRDVIGLLTWLCDQGHSAIWDAFGFRWWSADRWRGQVFDTSQAPWWPQVMILVSDEPDGAWYHTRGMIKFGRPDLSLRRVPPGEEGLATEIMNRFIELQARGGVIPDGAAVRLDGVPQGMTCRHGGRMDDPAFNNVHVEICWPD